mmetsp:Transcript_18243/g.69043  ORF Transcript_18243/g.69043 Transcript_18243/m.69043 type:complete len:203 (+) Transcript_18243:406-1014(+)
MPMSMTSAPHTAVRKSAPPRMGKIRAGIIVIRPRHISLEAGTYRRARRRTMRSTKTCLFDGSTKRRSPPWTSGAPSPPLRESTKVNPLNLLTKAASTASMPASASSACSLSPIAAPSASNSASCAAATAAVVAELAGAAAQAAPAGAAAMPAAAAGSGRASRMLWSSLAVAGSTVARSALPTGSPATNFQTSGASRMSSVRL